jgi:hypothetical protein
MESARRLFVPAELCKFAAAGAFLFALPLVAALGTAPALADKSAGRSWR